MTPHSDMERSDTKRTGGVLGQLKSRFAHAGVATFAFLLLALFLTEAAFFVVAFQLPDDSLPDDGVLEESSRSADDQDTHGARN